MSASIMSMASIRRPSFSGSLIRWYGTALIVLRANESIQGAEAGKVNGRGSDAGTIAE